MIPLHSSRCNQITVSHELLRRGFGGRVFKKEEGSICSHFELCVFDADIHEVAVSIVSFNMSQGILETFGSLECIEMVHFEPT
jgi:hypothetical protein